MAGPGNMNRQACQTVGVFKGENIAEQPLRIGKCIELFSPENTAGSALLISAGLLRGFILRVFGQYYH